MQNSAPEHAIFITKIKKKFWVGVLPRPFPPAGVGHPSCNYPRRRLDPRSFGARPLASPLQNPRYATEFEPRAGL